MCIFDCNSTSLPDWLGDMTSLQELSIVNCWELRSLPSSIQRLTNLSHLIILGCPHLEKRCKRETGEDWQFINHIPNRSGCPHRLFMVSSIVLCLLLSLVCHSLLENCVAFFGVCIFNNKTRFQYSPLLCFMFGTIVPSSDFIQCIFKSRLSQ